MRVYCYRNLNRKGVVWSAKSVETGLVVDRSPNILLKDCLLKVSAAGRRRAVQARQRNVHAGIVGKRTQRVPRSGWRKARYNPFETDSFVLASSGKPIQSAEYVKLTPRGLYVYGAR